MSNSSVGTTQIQFRAGEIEDEILARQQSMDQSANFAAKRDLERYYKLLDLIRPTFSEDEAHLLCDVLNGTRFEPIEGAATFLWAGLDDAEDAYYEKWSVQKEPFVARLRALSVPEAVATIDAVERFWNDDAASVETVGLT